MRFIDPLSRLKRHIDAGFGCSLRLMRHEGGATAIEFALVCVFAAMVTIAAMKILIPAIEESFPKAISVPEE